MRLDRAGSSIRATETGHISHTPPASPARVIDPTRIASNTVVIPTEASSPSWAMIAARWGQSTFGRGSIWRSRLSVCNSISPGTIKSPATSIALGKEVPPGRISAILPPSTRRVPWITSVSRTIRALVNVKSVIISSCSETPLLTGQCHVDVTQDS